MRLHRLIALLPTLLVAGAVVLHAQEYGDDSAPNPLRVLIGVKGGVVMSAARGDFPSLLIGDSKAGSGAIGSDRGQTGIGSRLGMELTIPFTSTLGLSTEFGLMHYVARYLGDSAQSPTRFDVQTLQLAPRLFANVMTDRDAFAREGLRTVYVAAGADIDLATLANRVEGTAVLDSMGTQISRVGSFANNEPFRTLVGLNVAVGLRFGLQQHIELQAEAGYSYALNPVFSSDVISDNDFSVDNFSLQIGLGYRF